MHATLVYGFTVYTRPYVCAASDGSLWTPVIRPISVPVVSQRTQVPAGSDMRDSGTDPRQLLPFESRRAASYSLPHGATGMNGPTVVDGPQSAGISGPHPRAGVARPRSVENMDLRTTRLPPDQGLLQIAPDSTARLSPLRSPMDSHRSLPRNLGHGRPPSTWSVPAEWPHQQHDQSPDRDRSRSLSADRRKFFPPLQQDRSLQRDERGRQLENTRREVRFVVM